MRRPREVALHVEPADRLSQRGVGRVDGPLPALAPRRRAGEHGAVEREGLLPEGLGQHRHVVLEGVEDEVVLPRRERRAGRQRRQAGQRARLPHDELRLGVQARGFEVRAPVEAGGGGVELPPHPAVVALLDVLGVLSRDMRLRHLVLEVEDGGRPAGRVGDVGEREHVRDVCAVPGADAGHARRGTHVIGAVRHVEPALQQEGQVAGRLVEVLRDPQAEEVVRVEVRGVQSVHVRAQRAAQHPRQRPPVGDAGDAVERGLEGSEAPRLDGRLVHVGRVVVADLPSLGAGGRVRAGGLLHDLVGALVRQLCDHGADAVGGAVGRDLRRLHPGAVGIREEVGPGRDGAIDAGEVEADAGRDRGRGRRGDGHRRPRHAEDAGEGEKGEGSAQRGHSASWISGDSRSSSIVVARAGVGKRRPGQRGAAAAQAGE